MVSPEDRELARENERLRRENRILKEERDILKRGKEDQKTIRGIVFPTAPTSDHTLSVAPNLLDRDFSAVGPNEK